MFMRLNGLYRSVVVAAIVGVIAMGGCVTGEKPSQAATDMANITADRILLSINDGSYADYTADFSAPMLNASPESSFDGLRDKIFMQFGKYESRSPAPQSYVSQGYNIFVYDCRFEKGRHTFRLVMDPSNVSLVQGIWFPDMKP
jgi:hypothetical protein